METVRPAGQNGSTGPGHNGVSDGPSVGTSLEHVVTASQSIITNRIELALLEGRALLARTVRGAAFIGLAIVLAAAAWFTAAASGVLFVLPDASPVVHLAAFALVNGGCAIVLIALAMRRGPKARGRGESDEAREPSTEGMSERGNH